MHGPLRATPQCVRLPPTRRGLTSTQALHDSYEHAASCLRLLAVQQLNKRWRTPASWTVVWASYAGCLTSNVALPCCPTSGCPCSHPGTMAQPCAPTLSVVRCLPASKGRHAFATCMGDMLVSPVGERECVALTSHATLLCYMPAVPCPTGSSVSHCTLSQVSRAECSYGSTGLNVVGLQAARASCRRLADFRDQRVHICLDTVSCEYSLQQSAIENGKVSSRVP